MARRLVSLTLDNVDDLPLPCRGCGLWELGDRNAGSQAKDEWLSAVLLESGRCGTIVYVDGEVAGFALYAPPEFVDGRLGFGTAPIGDDAIVLTTAKILPAYASAGLGRILIQAVVKDALSRRGVKAVEAYGDSRGEAGGCVLPAEFLSAIGFKTKNKHPRYPLYRLELRSVLRWKPELEVALERWLGAIRPEKAPGPVGARPRTDASGEIVTDTT